MLLLERLRHCGYCKQHSVKSWKSGLCWRIYNRCNVKDWKSALDLLRTWPADDQTCNIQLTKKHRDQNIKWKQHAIFYIFYSHKGKKSGGNLTAPGSAGQEHLRELYVCSESNCSHFSKTLQGNLKLDTLCQ